MCTVFTLENVRIIHSRNNLRSSKSFLSLKRFISLKFDVDGPDADPPSLLLLLFPQSLSQLPLPSLILLSVSLPDLPRLLHLFVHFVNPFLVFFLLRFHIDFELYSVLFAAFLFFLNSFCVSLQLTKIKPLPCTFFNFYSCYYFRKCNRKLAPCSLVCMRSLRSLPRSWPYIKAGWRSAHAIIQLSKYTVGYKTTQTIGSPL